MDNGSMIKCMEEVKRNGLMELSLQGFSPKALKLKVFSYGQLEIPIRASLKTINYRVLAYLLGVMADFTRVFGKIIKCMVKVNLNGPMAKNMKDSM